MADGGSPVPPEAPDSGAAAADPRAAYPVGGPHSEIGGPPAGGIPGPAAPAGLAAAEFSSPLDGSVSPQAAAGVGAKRPLRVVLLGPPNAGKGTQAAMLSSRLGVPAVSTGDVLRQQSALYGDGLAIGTGARVDRLRLGGLVIGSTRATSCP